jgi:hypothetical protein
VPDGPPDEAVVDASAAEPQRRPAVSERLRLDKRLLEPVVMPRERCRARPPGSAPDLELLVEPVAALGERHPERLVLRAVPPDRRLDDEPPAGQEVERRHVLREHQRMP